MHRDRQAARGLAWRGGMMYRPMSQREHSTRWFCPAFMAVLCVCTSDVSADVFLLQNGGQIHGQWLNRNQRPPAAYEIRTRSGGKLTLAASQVKRAIVRRDLQQQYERLASSAAETVEDQWKLAEWCREHHHPRQREVHLRHILRLDADHAASRRALGFIYVDGRWIIRREWLRSRGFQYYRGRWRLPQAIELIETRRKRQQAEKGWLARLKRWRKDLAGKNAQQAAAKIRAVNDPSAVMGLSTLLAGERARNVKLLYVEALVKIADSAAVKTLIAATLNDADIEVRIACIEQLVASKPPTVVETYIDALHGRSNVKVNRAARALAALGDRSAIGPLIDALVTTHLLTIVPPGGGSPDSITTSFVNPSSAGGGASSIPTSGGTLLSGSRAKAILLQVPNEEVLAALIALSQGAHFGFYKTAWRRWHAAQRSQSPVIKARRE